MKRSNKEIKAKIKELEDIPEGTMGGYGASDKIDILTRCLEMDEDEIDGEVEMAMDQVDPTGTNYELYATWDWAVEGREDC